MTSIRTYEGEIRICTSCGQPAYKAGVEEPDACGSWCHFTEQWDGIHCDMFPLADDVIAIDWNEQSLDHVKWKYPDTFPR